MTKEKIERILVTSALPYANGPLHVGHAIGAYIPADVYTRYHRLKGNDVLFICGTDEHGTPIAVSAEREGISPGDVVDKYHEIIKDAFLGIGISFDNFSRTTRKIHHELSQEFFLHILKKGLIYKKTVERPYCPKCGRFLPDRYVKGTCPHCGSVDERGDQCEACGKQLEPHELVDPYCATCGEPPEMRETEHWFFKLSGFSDRLNEWISRQKHWPDNARNFSLGWLREGLEDRAITRDLSWGVPVPVEGAQGKVLYVWFDAPIGYISATKEWAKNTGNPDLWKNYWTPGGDGGDCKIVHFLGKDNIPFHAIIWPAMLMAHGGYNLPWQIASNEYLTLEGKKMSTSRGWVLWLHDVLSEFEPDALRYYLLSISPQRHDSDFSMKDFQGRVNNELIATLGNFVHRSMTFIGRKDSIVPKPGEFDGPDETMLEFIKNAPDLVGGNLEKFRFLEALKELMSLAHHGNEYFQKKEPWKNENDSTLYVCANLCRTLAILSAPFLPFTAEKIWGILGIGGSVHEQGWDSASGPGIEGGHKIGNVDALFKKIDDEEIINFEDRFLKNIGGKKDKMEKSEETDYVEFEEFKRLDLRVARIENVRDHPKADKLYLLDVDLGPLGKRQIVAGIQQSYKKEELEGKRIVVIANLKPAEIRGQKSEGMLLAADDGGGPILLTAEKGVKPGSKIG